LSLSAFIVPLATASLYDSVHGVVNSIFIVEILFIGKSIVFARHQIAFDNVIALLACEIIYSMRVLYNTFDLLSTWFG
jgi:hypothetical protein